ncbi:MAG: phosphopantothenate/pantothenate synthetase [Hadesarchaea archaeon]|nr:phosphopantothenate/pantothenate synthetase [Hadesarchaea archaeon]
MNEINSEHPRADSLRVRKKLAEGFEEGLVTPEGLSAHGRGEAFDYILGESTTDFAQKAIEASVAELLLAEKPIISVNGNTAALVPDEIVEFARVLDAMIEVNLFHPSRERKSRIANHLKEHGAEEVLGIESDFESEIPEIKSNRGKVDERGIKIADTVLVPLEDGDRTEALKEVGKRVVTIDLNPMSRTAKTADVTIVDNLVRAFPLMITRAGELIELEKERLKEIVKEFDNQENLSETLKFMLERLEKLSREELE